MGILFIILYIYLAVGVLYLFVFAIAGKLVKSKVNLSNLHLNKIAVVIPAYKEDQIIIETVKQALLHDYPQDKYHVFVLADQLTNETKDKLKQLPITVIEVVYQKSTKAKALYTFFENIDQSLFDIVMVLDADNIMKSGCLQQVNNEFAKGSLVVQCHRIAKNKNSSLAILDAISEEIRINIFFSGQRAFGLSSELIGSGMAFSFSLLKTILQNKKIQDSAGEDKEMFLQLIKYGVSVSYLNEAYVLDEKVASLSVFKKQRKRWIESQLQIIKRFFDPEFKQVRNKFEFWYRLFQNLLLPRSFYLLLLPLFSVLVYLLEQLNLNILPASTFWLGMTIIFWLSLIISIPSSYLNARTVIALIHLPAVLMSMVSAAAKAKVGNNTFIPTEKVYDKFD
jgi:cellulose synthase/poly-beta-1,6-N-acetylglucosamine synthase-like glycosyltransferase